MTKRRRRFGIVWVVVLFGTGNLGAQVYHPEGGFIYDDSELPRIDLTISQDELHALYADPYSDQEYPAHFKFTRGTISEELAEVGIRCRGNTSRDKQKKSFRISFNTFQKGREFHELEKMNLNAEVNDPSMVRSKLSWTVFRKLGIASVRSNHVLLYINKEFFGVYINTEHIDENFVGSRFGTNDGNHYKCTYPADLSYKGESPEDYKYGDENNRVYDLRINKEWDDYGDLSEFISVIDRYSASGFMEEIEKVMNVQQYLKVMAVDIMLANWDGYIGNKNNFYLYRDQVTGRFEYIPYDLDNTWGLDWLGVDWTRQSIYNWAREERPLYDKIMEQEVYRNQLTGYVKELAAYISSDALEQEVLRWRSQISSWVSQDPFYSLDFGYSYSDFQNALSTGIPDKWWLPYGVLEYASLRAVSAVNECEQVDALPLVSHARVKPTHSMIHVDWSVEDDQEGFSTSLHYRLDEGEWQSISPAAPGLTDLFSGIGTFQYSIPVSESTALAEIYMTASDNMDQESSYPVGTNTLAFPLVSGPLLINEFMASNSNTKTDEFGEYDDWVEIYNPTLSRVWLGSLFLSDKKGSPGKYKFPFEYLESKGFYLVWLDGQPEQGENHAPFKLSKSGEVLRLSDRPAEGYAIIDSLSFREQESDVAMGRSGDGGPGWIAFTHPTPGYSNLLTHREKFLAGGAELVLYPNPVYEGLLYFSQLVSGTIFDMTGKQVLEISNTRNADVHMLNPGIYLFRPQKGETISFVVAGGL